MPGVVLAVTDRDPAGGPGPSATTAAGEAEGELAHDPPFLAETARGVIEWAHGRALRASSVTGISVALALCAATWLTAGTRTGNFKAALALAGSYLAVLAGRALAAGPGPARRIRGFATIAPSTRAKTRWLAAIGWSVSECALYAGLAIGAAADHWSGMWILAIGVLAMVAVRELMTAAMWPGEPADGDRGLLRRAVTEALRMPPGGRVLLIALAAPVWGSRAVLLALLDWTIIAVGFGLASLQGPPRDPAAAPAPAPARPPGPMGLAMLLPAGADQAGQRIDPAAVDALELPGDDVEPQGERPVPPPSFPPKAAAAEPGEPDEAAQWCERLVLLRDDGVLARNLGTLVRGNLLPLPPAVLGLVATAVLTYLGMQSVPGILIISPCLIMLLAAPGSGNLHAGRLDWLVPAVLFGWQCLYLTTVGQAQHVPAAATFALCAALAVRYADLACAGRPVILARPMRRNWTMDLTEGDRERGSALGWEGRMLLMGAAAAAGLGTLAYVALTAYLGMLICVKVLTSCLGLREGDSR
jgi:hypothetical protein